MVRPQRTLGPRWLAGFAWIGVATITPVGIGMAGRNAHAAPTAAKGDREKAGLLFAEAETAFANGNFGVALQKFEAAQAIAFSPVVNFNIAVCLERLGRTEEAAKTYNQVADDADVPADVRERARRQASSLQPAYQAPAAVAPTAAVPPLPAAPLMNHSDGLTLGEPITPKPQPSRFGPTGWVGVTAAGLGAVAAGVVWALGSANLDAYNKETDRQRAETLADRGDAYDVAWKLSLGVAITGGVAVLVDQLWLRPRR